MPIGGTLPMFLGSSCRPIFLFVLRLVFSCASIPLLSFTHVRDANHDNVVYITNYKPYMLLDASARNSRIVYFAQRTTYMEQSLIYSCQVNTQAKPLLSVSLCCRKDLRAEKRCHRIKTNTQQGKIICHDTTFSYSMNLLTGANFTIEIGKEVDLAAPINGLFSCSVTNSAETTIYSNEFEVRDAVYYVRQLPTTPTNRIAVVTPLQRANFPYVFQCFDDFHSRDWPSWMHLLGDLFGTYQWGYCSITEPMNALLCNKRRSPLPNDAALAFLNGTVFLLDPDFFVAGDRAIMCKEEERDAPINTFAGAVSDASAPVHTMTRGLSLSNVSSPESQLLPLVSMEQNFTFAAGSEIAGLSLRALYREPSEGSGFQWFKDEEPSPNKLVTKFSHPLPSVADIKMSGVYKLIVTSGINRLVFVFRVNVVFPPVFTDPDCLSDLFYVVKGMHYATMCPYSSSPLSKTYVGVNNYEALSTEELLGALRKGVLINPKLSELDITFAVHESESNNKQVELRIGSMQTGQDFELSIRLHDSHGESRTFSHIKVIPTPKLVNYPQSSSCLQDCDVKPYNVSCSLDPDLVAQWKHQYDISPTISWVIQNQWHSDKLDPDTLGRFIIIPIADGSVLSIWPQGIPDSTTTPRQQEDTEDDDADRPAPPSTLRQFIIESDASDGEEPPVVLSLRCRIRLFVHSEEVGLTPPPGSLLTHRSKRQSSGTEPRLLYDSVWESDPSLVAQLKATRMFTPEQLPASASLTWIAAVVLGVLLLIVVVALSIWLFTRDRGETYKLYEKERAHGNDPIQEIKETEGFKTYQRQEEQPIASSRYSLNDGSLHVGSDEDGELEEYDKDYNEQGSFIHDYATDPALSRPIFDSPSLDISANGPRRPGQNHPVV